MVCIVHKIDFHDGSVRYTPIGYTTDEEACATLNAEYDSTYEAWINDNKEALENGSKQISEFFDVTPVVHVAKTGTDTPGELEEIEDLTAL